MTDSSTTNNPGALSDNGNQEIVHLARHFSNRDEFIWKAMLATENLARTYRGIETTIDLISPLLRKSQEEGSMSTGQRRTLEKTMHDLAAFVAEVDKSEINFADSAKRIKLLSKSADDLAWKLFLIMVELTGKSEVRCMRKISRRIRYKEFDDRVVLTEGIFI